MGQARRKRQGDKCRKRKREKTKQTNKQKRWIDKRDRMDKSKRGERRGKKKYD